MSEHINNELEWTDFKIENLEVISEHHDQGTQPIKEDNEFPNNDNDGYASPTTDSPSHSQTPHTPSTNSSQVNSQVTPNISIHSIHQSDNGSTSNTNSHSHFDHTPLRGYRTLSDLYENTEELLLAEDEPKNYKEASSDQKWIEAMKVELDSINKNNAWELTWKVWRSGITMVVYPTPYNSAYGKVAVDFEIRNHRMRQLGSAYDTLQWIVKGGTNEDLGALPEKIFNRELNRRT
ncbi:hypothetical protein Tco_0831631 [Tanacetum coccineum]